MVVTMQSNGSGGGGGDPPEEFVEVWSGNLEEEFTRMRKLVLKFPYIAMDTEFPGVVARPLGEFKTTSDYQYQLLKCNCNLLKLIQLGITFYDKTGSKAPGLSTFQFNFKFNLGEDMFAQDSIDMLSSAGIQFKRHEEEGIEVEHFAELFISSGLVMSDDITWVTFASSYDFGYLVRLLTSQKLPDEEGDFFELMSIHFPRVYDVKYLMKSCKNLKGGLQEVAESLQLERVGIQHQAGSDSYLTGAAFFRMKQQYFEDAIDDEKYCGYLYGLGNSYTNGNGNGNGNGFSLMESSQ